jgi:uncharacterized protein
VIVFEVRDGELVEALTKQAADAGITDAAIVALIGAVDQFTLSTMPPDDARRDVLTTYQQPAELSGTGEIVGGSVHVHATAAVNGNLGLSGHLHNAEVHTWFVRAYLQPLTA